MTHPNLRSFMDLSTAHLSIETRGWLTSRAEDQIATHWVAGFTYGWFIYCDEENAENDIPADLFACMTYARANGAEHILFDRDADGVSDLPTFED